LTKPFRYPMPGTRPYMINPSTYATGKDLVLSRNPFYHPDNTNTKTGAASATKVLTRSLKLLKPRNLAGNDVLARSLWRKAENQIMMAAPIVPTEVQRVPCLTSSRVGEVEDSPPRFHPSTRCGCNDGRLLGADQRGR
jgi:hypothetical protein